MHEYDAIADWYARERSSTVGVAEILDALRDLPPGSRVLDVGCGYGLPIARALLDRGFAVHGIDSSPRMVERFRANVPEATVACETALGSSAFDREWDAIVSWGMVFHLDHDAQRALIAAMSRALRPGGVLVFTSGPEHGTRSGTMNGVAFHYWSLAPDEYATALREGGSTLMAHFDDPGANHVYVARRERQLNGAARTS